MTALEDMATGIGDVTTPAELADLLSNLITTADGELAYGGQWGRAAVVSIRDRGPVTTLEVDLTRALYDHSATSPYDSRIDGGGQVRRFVITVQQATR